MRIKPGLDRRDHPVIAMVIIGISMLFGGMAWALGAPGLLAAAGLFLLLAAVGTTVEMCAAVIVDELKGKRDVQ